MDKYQIVRYKISMYSARAHKAMERTRYGVMLGDDVLEKGHISYANARNWIVQKQTERKLAALPISSRSVLIKLVYHKLFQR